MLAVMAVGVVTILAVVLIVAALVFYLVSVIVQLRRITTGLDEVIAHVGEIVAKSAPVNDVVTGINEQCVWILFPDFPDECCTARDASLPCIPVVGGQRIDLRVCVVGMKDRDYGVRCVRFEQIARKRGECRCERGGSGKKCTSIDHLGSSIVFGPGPT